MGMGEGLLGVIFDCVPGLLSAAQKGDTHGAMVSTRRLLERLRAVDPAAAEQLKSLLPRARATAAAALRRTGTPDPVALPRDRESSAGLLARIDTTNAAKPVMAPSQAKVLEALLHEHRHAARLAEAGISPRSTVFLVGPPGVGKTMTATWLAKELRVPLFSLEIPSLISSYLGRTGQNLREVFDFARATPAVVLLDEFDAVAKRRDDASDLGEMRRIVSVLLKEIEEWPGPSILVAATNHPGLIDPAIFRRFQLVVEVEAPTLRQTASILRLHLEGLTPSEATLRVASHVLVGRSGSEIRDVAHESRRAAALNLDITADEALLRSVGRRAHTTDERRTFARVARSLRASVSLQDVADWLGVSKTTVFNYVSEGERDA